MAQLHLIRTSYGSVTQGCLYLFDRGAEIFLCDTLEPPSKEINPFNQHPCIPAGIYPLSITFSPKFRKKLPLLSNVKGREGIRIHTGNSAADTLGCILVGLNYSSDGVTLQHSKISFDYLMSILHVKSFNINQIRITDYGI